MRTAFYASKNLKRLYDERAGETQTEFAKRLGIGQSMLNQIMSRRKTLSVDVAKKLARELHCTISEICPEMAEYIREEVLPTLGKSLRRAAALLLCVGSLSVPLDAEAFNNKKLWCDPRQVAEYNNDCIRRRIMYAISRILDWCGSELHDFLTELCHIRPMFRTMG